MLHVTASARTIPVHPGTWHRLGADLIHAAVRTFDAAPQNVDAGTPHGAHKISRPHKHGGAGGVGASPAGVASSPEPYAPVREHGALQLDVPRTVPCVEL